MSNQFLQFIEEIASTDWEYGDGVSMTEDARKHLDEFNNLAGRVTELEQHLAKKDKQLFEENLQVKRLEQQLAEAYEELALSIKKRIELGGKLSHYQGGVEVEGFVNRRGLLELDDILPDTLDSQRVRVLVMKEAE